jgi:uncharacterized protein
MRIGATSTTEGITTETEVKSHIRKLSWWLLGLGVVIAGLLIALNSGDGRAPATTFRIFSTRFLGIFIEAVPFLLMGTIVSGLLEVFVTREDIVRWMPRHPVPATIAGGFMGFIFPVCECGVVPVTRRLFTKGLPMSAGIAFLLAAPVMNPIVLVSTYIAFGWGPMLAGRFIITAVVAIAVGVIFAIASRPHEVLRTAHLAPVTGGSNQAAPLPPPRTRRSLAVSLYDALRFGADEFFEMGRFLVLGCMMAAGMQTLVSQEALLMLGEGPLVSVLVLQALAFVLSVCSTVDSFLALAFLGTFTGGSIMAFLTFGPMVDIKSVMMFLGVFKRKTVLYLILLPLLMTMLAGVWINLFVPY